MNLISGPYCVEFLIRPLDSLTLLDSKKSTYSSFVVMRFSRTLKHFIFLISFIVDC